MTENPAPELVKSIIELRRDLHRYPELGYQEERTARKVVESLRDISDLEISTGIAGTGVVALMHGSAPGPCIALRADMDALPIQEEGAKDWISQHPGLMHACGHDGHTACLVGAAKLLAKRRKEFRGSIKFIFQPAEEGGGGALKMCQEGVLQEPRVRAIFGAHCWPREPWGQLCLSVGPAMASYDDFHMTVRGRGGHAAAPHLSVDPVVTGAQIVVAAQQLVSRFRNPLKSAVVSICQFNAGTATNVIPEFATIAGTIRTYDQELRVDLRQRLGSLAQGIASAVGASVDFQVAEGYPAVVNEVDAFGIVERVGLKLFGSERVNSAAEPSMGAEDFAYYLQEVPGMFWKFGMRRDAITPQLHTPQFDFCDESVPFVMKMHEEVALAALEHYYSEDVADWKGL
jgi:amidohydrolase